MIYIISTDNKYNDFRYFFNNFAELSYNLISY